VSISSKFYLSLMFEETVAVKVCNVQFSESNKRCIKALENEVTA
jgi:hypothetical protein